MEPLNPRKETKKKRLNKIMSKVKRKFTHAERFISTMGPFYVLLYISSKDRLDSEENIKKKTELINSNSTTWVM